MKNRQSTWAIALLLLSLCGFAGESAGDPGSEHVQLAWTHDLVPGESVTFDLPGNWRQLKRVRIQAESYGTYAGQRPSLQVVVNGRQRALQSVWGHSSSFRVDVNENTQKIVLRNCGRYGTIRLTSVAAELGWETHPPILHPPHPIPPKPFPPISYPVRNEPARMARQGITLVDALRPFADPETEYIEYLLPIKKLSGRALAKANAHGPGSNKTERALLALADSIEEAAPYIEQTLKKEAPFELAVDLLSLMDRIRDYWD